MKKYRILWVEDGARFDLSQFAAPVYMNGSYDLKIAENATDCLSYLESNEFEVIILDIRIPPGDGPDWIKLYRKAGNDKVAARLGLKLLYSMLVLPDAEIILVSRPSWISAEKIGILTVDSRKEVENELLNLGIQVYHQKKADVPVTILLDVINQVIEQTETPTQQKE